MTNFKQIRSNGKRGRNIKDGPCYQSVKDTGFWGLAGFMPTAPGKWTYTGQDINCPVFQVIESAGKTTATLDGGEIQITFMGMSHIDIKDFLDDQILRLIRLQADADTLLLDWRPVIVNGQEIGPEIEF